MNARAKTLVVRTKLMPPRLHRRILPRPRLTERLLEALDYRLTIIQAGAGFGKSTALAALGQTEHRLVWYALGSEDVDPLVVLLHLAQGISAVHPLLGAEMTSLLESWTQGSGSLPWAEVVDWLTNRLAEQLTSPLLVVLDEFHMLGEASDSLRLIDRLIGRAPSDLHIILATRYPVKLPTLSAWRVRGEVLLIDQAELAFNMDEIGELFSQHYGLNLNSQQARQLASETEGWAIALQLYWQGVRSGAVKALPVGGEGQPLPADELFVYLAQEVLEQQSPDVQDFLRVTAALRELSTQLCDCLRQKNDSREYLRYLLDNGLFVVELGGESIRYHHLFREFLLHKMSEEERRDAHLLCAGCYLSRGDDESALYHLLRAAAFDQAAEVLARLGEHLVHAGRLDALNQHLSALPPEVLESHPQLLNYLGDSARLHSRFDEALGWYHQAEERCRLRSDIRGINQALHGQARVYLDTVNPSQAERVLQEALRLADGQEDRENRARLLELLAENRLNAGQLQQAEQFQSQALNLREVGIGETELYQRVLMRTGRLEQARTLMEAQVEAERHEPVLRPRAHRETLLLLSFVLSIEGEAEKALAAAREGTQRGINLQSPFVSAVGYMRQGHALTLNNTPEAFEQARQQFEKAVEISLTLDVSRLRVEAYWGLCRTYSYQGDFTRALQIADEGIQIATQAGDEWVAALVCLGMGSSLVLAGRYAEGEDWLSRAVRGFELTSDPFSRSAARLWICVSWWRQKKLSRLPSLLSEVLAVGRDNNYEFLFTRSTLLGVPDERILVPLLIHARQQGWEVGYVARLLHTIGLPEIDLHPGYRLRVNSLGGFQVWRGTQPIAANGWRRDKARQLFQLLIANRATPLDRDQIVELLWPQLDPPTAQRNFKVALNALYQVLEPERDPGGESAYICRENTTYVIRPGADLWLDADEFIQRIQQAEALLNTHPSRALSELNQALQLYQGEFLPDERYETWAAAERERLSVIFLRTADRLSELYLQANRYAEAIELCQRILGADDCWERAYRHLMTAFDALGDRGQVARTYQRCLQVLRQELEVEPSPETEALYERLTGG